MTGLLGNPTIRLVLARLREGLGVEDIAIRDGVPAEVTRRIIREHRKRGTLRAKLKGSKRC